VRAVISRVLGPHLMCTTKSFETLVCRTESYEALICTTKPYRTLVCTSVSGSVTLTLQMLSPTISTARPRSDRQNPSLDHDRSRQPSGTLRTVVQNEIRLVAASAPPSPLVP
jgi:hypothetical protein